jgi:hypothetical protein
MVSQAIYTRGIERRRDRAIPFPTLQKGGFGDLVLAGPRATKVPDGKLFPPVAKGGQGGVR